MTRIATELPRTFNSGKQPIARIDAILGFSNTPEKPKWRGKIPSVTFMAETTEGVLAHWWRGSMKKFKEEDEHKLSLQFEVDLSSATTAIICYFACEDIVGTVVTRRLEHGLPPSAFPPRKESTSQLSQTSGKSAASLMDDDIGDNDLLDIAKEGPNQSQTCAVVLEDSYVDFRSPIMNRNREYQVDDRVPKQNDDFASSQDSEKEIVPWQPIQLPNGKFKCNHHCADAGLKNGNGKKAKAAEFEEKIRP
ncbi:ATP-dependent DNA helicase MER3 [Diaporthe eres]|uniref:ATP-dependent DNA helicase MER3 n=1 Tax=Diaporthe eres TaxID=83184 RepID=A0ABR1P670_DIAER